ncbi:MAG TPA: cation:proton antiporter [Pseudomonadales bacterium]|nr:cation:proton antiporter [Pseudomonadales bacterium]
MHEETPLLALTALGLAFAFIFGFIAIRLKSSPIIGYLVAGIIMGPYTPGFTGDAHLAQELAEIGVILLMFGVGMHFSVADLWAMRTVSVPGAISQIIVATALGAGVSHLWGWSWSAGVIFGLALSTASTVVMLRALESCNALDSADGKITIGWTIVEDVVMVLALVLLPAFFGQASGDPETHTSGTSVWVSFSIALGKVALFIVLMLLFGTRLFPWILKKVERTGSSELFTLAVVTIAIGVAYGASELFGCSFALGAFFAGVVVNQSDLHHRAADALLPLQHSFGTLFFVAIGMLFDPMILVRHPFQVLAVVAIIVIGKSLAAFGIVLLLRKPLSMALLVSAALAQIGEFSFILSALGVSLGVLTNEAENLIIGGALISILINPLGFQLIRRMGLVKPTPS